MLSFHFNKDTAAALAGKLALQIRTEPLQEQTSQLIYIELIASTEIDVQGTIVRAFQRRGRH